VFDDLNLREVVAGVDRTLKSGIRGWGYVVPVNVDVLVRYRQDAAFRVACERAALRVADGMPIVWAARLLGRPLRGRVTGADLLPALCRLAAANGHAVFLLGGRRGVAERAAARLSAKFPGLHVVGTYSPPDHFEPEGEAAEAAVHAVNAAKPALLFVALGSPKQELWVHRHWDRLDTVVAVCVGAAIDFAAGSRTRAPGWMQRAGLEWFWRLALEPGRLWKRYLVQDAAFLGIFLKEWWRERIKTPGR
jgi:N-acetylglucosaminyldiphosphoundecaprenol N-acetyl-beta-D-mannosaminyltransferase